MGNYWSEDTTEISWEQLNTHIYGWKRDTPDHRDHLRQFTSEDFSYLTAAVDLRDKCPSIYAKGKLGSCTSNSIAFAYQFD